MSIGGNRTMPRAFRSRARPAPALLAATTLATVALSAVAATA